ncbi:MAG: hypothetical protein V7K97_12185 [Nostoc sp.]
MQLHKKLVLAAKLFNEREGNNIQAIYGTGASQFYSADKDK